MPLVIKGGTVLALDSAAVAPRVHDVLVEGDRIAAIGPDLPSAGAEVIDASGAIVLPGLIDTHTHAWQYAFRGALSRGWGFRDYLAPFEHFRGRYSAQDTYDAIRGCGLAQLDAGVTGVVDFLHGANATSEHLDAAVRAHVDTGQRTLLAIGNTAVAGEDRDGGTFETARLQRLDSVRRLATAGLPPTVRVGLGLITPTASTESRVLAEVDFGRSLGLQMTVHQNRPGEIGLLAANGRLGPDMLVVHANTASADDVAVLAETGAGLSTTPQSEIGAGWSPDVLRRAFRAGVHVSVGIDTPSTLSIDLWLQLRALHLLVEALDGEEARRVGRYPIDSTLDPLTLGYEDVLRAATVEGAYGMWGADERLGILTAGALADIVVVRPRDPDAAEFDIPSYLVQVGSPEQVEAVVVNGVVRKRDGALVDVDRDELAATNRAVRGRVMADY